MRPAGELFAPSTREIPGSLRAGARKPDVAGCRAFDKLRPPRGSRGADAGSRLSLPLAPHDPADFGKRRELVAPDTRVCEGNRETYSYRGFTIFAIRGSGGSQVELVSGDERIRKKCSATPTHGRFTEIFHPWLRFFKHVDWSSQPQTWGAGSVASLPIVLRPVPQIGVASRESRPHSTSSGSSRLSNVKRPSRQPAIRQDLIALPEPGHIHQSQPHAAVGIDSAGPVGFLHVNRRKTHAVTLGIFHERGGGVDRSPSADCFRSAV